MDSALWGFLVLFCGIFIASYGNILFRFVLAFIGFAIGFSLVMWLGGSMDPALRILLGVVVGGILAAVLYMLVKFALYIAGGLLGLVLMLALLGLFKFVGVDFGILGGILVLAATGLGSFFGNRLGNLVVILATSLAGAYFVVLGLSLIFKLGVETGDPGSLTATGFALVLFLTIAAISGLAQHQAFSLRRRFLR